MTQHLTHGTARRDGFTLLELAVVLIIIGLVTGGIFVGSDLIKTSAARSQVTQLMQYRAAVNGFHDKYAALPGDFVNAASIGFAARGTNAGEGDGNGVIEGVTADAASSNYGWAQTIGETVLFWMDLGKAGMIENSFTAGAAASGPTSITPTTLASYFPEAKIGNGAYVMATSRSPANYFVVEGGIASIAPGSPPSATGGALSVAQAYYVDTKIDDGLPMTGAVTSEWLTSSASGFTWGPGYPGVDQGYASVTASAVAPSTATCIDNGNSATINYVYSMTYSNNRTCGLMVQF